MRSYPGSVPKASFFQQTLLSKVLFEHKYEKSHLQDGKIPQQPTNTHMAAYTYTDKIELHF